MKQFVALARESSREQEREGFSLEVQEEALERYAKQAGGKIVKLLRMAECTHYVGVTGRLLNFLWAESERGQVLSYQSQEDLRLISSRKGEPTIVPRPTRIVPPEWPARFMIEATYYFASAASFIAASSFVTSSEESSGRSTLITSLLSLAVRVNGGL